MAIGKVETTTSARDSRTQRRTLRRVKKLRKRVRGTSSRGTQNQNLEGQLVRPRGVAQLGFVALAERLADA